jgi:hypothetical protein
MRSHTWPYKAGSPCHTLPRPGGAELPDITGRTLAARLSTSLGQQVVIENKPGAGGAIGADWMGRDLHPMAVALCWQQASTRWVEPGA